MANEPVEPEGEGQDIEQSEPERPEWLPENFKTGQDFVKSYHEASGKIIEQGAALNRLEEQIGELTQAVQSQQQPQYNQSDVQDQWQEMYDNNPVGTAAYMAKLAAQQAVQEAMALQASQAEPQFQSQHELVAYAAEQDLSARYDDWSEYKEKVATAVQNDPTLLPDSAFSSLGGVKNALDRIYKVVKAEDVLSRSEQAGTQQADQSRQAKMAAQTLSGASSRPGEPSPEEASAARILAASKGGDYTSLRGS